MVNAILMEMFMARVEPCPATGCWLWTGTMDGTYGVVVFQKQRFLAHRLAYLLFRGPLTKGLQIDHLCRTRACANPDHIEQVTRRENIRRGVSPVGINARRTHCKEGHLFDRQYRTTGERYCGVCRKMEARQRRTTTQYQAWRKEYRKRPSIILREREEGRRNNARKRALRAAP